MHVTAELRVHTRDPRLIANQILVPIDDRQFADLRVEGTIPKRVRNVMEHNHDRGSITTLAATPENRVLRTHMTESVYRVTEVIGTSTDSWEAAARAAIETAARTVRDLRVAEVVKLDLTIDENRVTSFRARLNISFKYERGE